MYNGPRLQRVKDAKETVQSKIAVNDFDAKKTTHYTSALFVTELVRPIIVMTIQREISLWKKHYLQINFPHSTKGSLACL